MIDDKELAVCPKCRGYSLEKRWCTCCKGSGVISKTKQQSTGITTGLQGISGVKNDWWHEIKKH